MKINTYLLGLFSLTTLLPLMPSLTPSVNACAVVAPSVQVAVQGSEEEAQQQSNVNVTDDGKCFNNNIVSPNVQVGTSSGQVQQNYTGDFHIGGGDLNNTGLTTPTTVVDPHIGVSIENSPAYDPEFLNHLR
ncbi:MAG: hypothetical protein ACFCU5_15855 [Pleurocapsa sp.]